METSSQDLWEGEIELSEHHLSDGTRIAIRRARVSSSGPEILLVHGIAEHSGRWEHVLRHFASRGYDVMAYDLRGHGASDGARVTAPSFQTHIDDLGEIVDHLGGSALIYGHSMGGLVALGHALSDAHQKAYVLSAPALEANVPFVLYWIGRIISRVAPGCRLPLPLSGESLSARPEVAEAARMDPLIGKSTTAGFGRSFVDAMTEIRGRMENLTVPTLVIHGEADSIVPASGTQELGQLDVVKRILFPGLRHELHNEEEWEEILDRVANWIETGAKDRKRSEA